jgi:hypothetical protein
MSSVPPAEQLLEAHLWDLRAAGESKLRCLTRVQQLLTDYTRLQAAGDDKAQKRAKIIADLSDVVTITAHLRASSAQALEAAHKLA